MHELLVLRGAESEIIDTYVRYESASDGLGERFYQSVDRAFRQLSSFPQSAPPFVGPVRRMLVPAFPHGIFYSIESERVIIQAVLDLRQSSEQILRRLDHALQPGAESG
jgi:hypothetical protein